MLVSYHRVGARSIATEHRVSPSAGSDLLLLPFQVSVLGFNGAVINGQQAQDYILSPLRTSLQSIFDNDLTICLGPAGTGKTYLAVAFAIAALKRGQFHRIILTRPAVEAETLIRSRARRTTSFFFPQRG